jgi:predicted nucleic acid-binding protein
MINVVYDACILYSAPLRDFMIHLAEEKMFCACWSNMIHEEWIRSVLRNRTDLKREHLERTRRAMDNYAENCLITGFEYLIDTLQLPDKNDRHVLAAAIHVNAKYIVTFNLVDFPKSIVTQYGIKVITPDDFICYWIRLMPEKVLMAAAKHRANLKNPPKSVEQYLATLANQHLTKTTQFLQNYLTEL